MPYLQYFLSPHSSNSSSHHPFSLIPSNYTAKSSCGYDGNCGGKRNIGKNFQLISRKGVKKDSEFEIDPDKARESLRKLDQQLQSLSQKPVPSPKIRASDLNFKRNQLTEPVPDNSGPSLAYWTLALLLFTIFYNVLYFTVLEPSTDGSEPAAATSSLTEASETPPFIEFSPTPEVFVQP